MRFQNRQFPASSDGSRRGAIRSGKEVPRIELKIDLPSPYHAVGSALNGMAQRRAMQAYVKICRSMPPCLTVPELLVAKRIAENPIIVNPEFFRARAFHGREFDVVCAEFYRNGIFLEWHHLNDLRRFFSQGRALETGLSINGKRFLIRREGGEIVAEHSLRNALQESLSAAISLVHLRDMIQTCSLSAAAKYADSSRTLRSPKMREILQPMFSYLSKEGENPKMESLGLLLSEREGRRCLVICETGEQKEVLCSRFPGAAATNHPKKDSMAGFESVILYNPTGHSVEAAWKSGACEIIVLVAKGTADEGRYWQKSKEEDAKRNPARGVQGKFEF